ncbi:MAG TPA: peptidoglycan-binding domain-containing protein [Pyrinomonadaceae bacterium]|nr:peptidoglycan-binding domain-containing protein [Pyrinomonadaceae bacterium]
MSEVLNVLVKLIGVKAPMPLMHFKAAEKYEDLRGIVIAGAGFDFLATCGDIFREANFQSTKDGVANRSWHKTGRAFDYDQNSPALVLVAYQKNNKTYFRTFLKCAKQDGSLGKKQKVKDFRGYLVEAYLFDFTEAAVAVGFSQIPAWSGWENHYNRREFWHYQFDEGLTWDAAMLQLKGKTRLAEERVLGLNDRGEDVRVIQSKLADLKLLPTYEVDSVFGAKTKAAVEKFQQLTGLDADGVVGAKTRAKLFQK